MYSLSAACVTALLLSLAAAAPTPEECVDLNKTVAAEELHTIFGKWILHEAYATSGPEASGRWERKSFQTELIPSDNQTVILKQANMGDETCTRYSINFTVVGNTIQHKYPTRNATFKADFLKTCDDCLMMRYSTVTKGENAISHLLFYKKTEMLPQADQERSGNQAKCQGFLQPPLFTYKQGEMCPEQSDDTSDA